MLKNKILRISDVYIDKKIYPRDSINKGVVKEYAKATTTTRRSVWQRIKKRKQLFLEKVLKQA